MPSLDIRRRWATKIMRPLHKGLLVGIAVRGYNPFSPVVRAALNIEQFNYKPTHTHFKSKFSFNVLKKNNMLESLVCSANRYHRIHELEN